MAAGFNPFIGKPAVVINPKADELVARYAAHLMETAAEAATSGKKDSTLFQDQQNLEWLLEKVDDILELPKWTPENIAELGSLCFYLLTSGVDTIDGPEEG